MRHKVCVGTVVVTTPQRLALVDVVKGVEMFARMKVPTLAIVENMAYFDSPSDGVRLSEEQPCRILIC